MRRDRDERGERGKEKKYISRSGSPTHCRSVLNQLRGSHSRCHAMVLDIFGGRPNAPPPPGGRRWLLQSRAAGSESPVPCSSPDMADGSRLRPLGERRRLLRSLLDGSHPSSTQEPAASLPSHLIFYHSSTTASGSHWRSPLLRAARPPQHREPPQQRGLLLPACPSFLPGFGTNVTKFVEREEGGGNRRTFNRL